MTTTPRVSVALAVTPTLAATVSPGSAYFHLFTAHPSPPEQIHSIQYPHI